MIIRDGSRSGRASGLTLIELVVGLALSVIVMTAAMDVFITCMRWRHRSDLFMRVSAENSGALERLVYGASGRGGLREAYGAVVTPRTNGWILTYHDASGATQTYAYDTGRRTLVYTPLSLCVCTDVVYAAATTNSAGDRLTIRLDVRTTEGRDTCSNSMSTLVGFRNVHAD